MKQDYTLDELQTEMTALAQLFDSVTLADPRMGLLDPATLQPLNKVAAMPALDAAGRGLKIEKAADGLRTVIAQGITVADTPCVLLLGMPLPRNLQADGAEDAFARALSQMQDDLRRDYVTGVYNSVYLNEVFRPRAERAALDGKPVEMTYCYDGGALRYLITRVGGKQASLEYLSVSDKVDESLLKLPEGYTVCTKGTDGKLYDASGKAVD